MSSKLEVYPTDFDSRMVEWNLKHNKITRDQLKTYLAALPDEVANSMTMTLDESDEEQNHGDSNGTV